jgi:O-antigen/teichoic acid export membrane protein
MKLKKNGFLGKSIVFTAMTFIQKGIAFLLVPLYTHLLSPEQYGIVNLANSVAAIYILIASFALDDAMTRYYFQYRNDKRKIKETVTTITVVALLLSIVIFILLIIINKVLIKPFAGNIEFFPYMLLALFPVLSASIYGIVQKILIIEGKAIHYSINTFSFFLVNTGLCLLFVVVFRWSAVGFLLANAITYGVYFVYSIIFLVPKMSFSFDKKICKEGVKYGLILLPNRIASWGMGGLNKILVGNALSVAALGVLNIATTFALLLNVFANSLSLSLQPWVFNKLEQGEKGKNDIFKITNVLAAAFCLCGLSVSLFAKEIISLLIDKRYLAAINVIPILIFGTISSAYSVLFIHVLFYYKKYSKYIAFSTIFGAVINILTCLILVPNLGVMGACIAMAVSEFFVLVIKMVFSLKAIGQRFAWIKMYLFLFISFIFSQISLQFNVYFMFKVGIYFLFICMYSFAIKGDLRHFKAVFRKSA